MLLIGDGHGFGVLISWITLVFVFVYDVVVTLELFVNICNLVIWLIRWGNVCASATS